MQDDYKKEKDKDKEKGSHKQKDKKNNKYIPCIKQLII